MSSRADDAVQTLAANALRRYAQIYAADHLSWRDFADDAREDLATLAEAGMLNIYLARELAPCHQVP
jgi:hypothetical protein